MQPSAARVFDTTPVRISSTSAARASAKSTYEFISGISPTAPDRIVLNNFPLHVNELLNEELSALSTGDQQENVRASFALRLLDLETHIKNLHPSETFFAHWEPERRNEVWQQFVKQQQSTLTHIHAYRENLYREMGYSPAQVNGVPGLRMADAPPDSPDAATAPLTVPTANRAWSAKKKILVSLLVLGMTLGLGLLAYYFYKRHKQQPRPLPPRRVVVVAPPNYGYGYNPGFVGYSPMSMPMQMGPIILPPPIPSMPVLPPLPQFPVMPGMQPNFMPPPSW